jgi:glycosyltransferase involved in cell wall biosynthesis
MTTSKKYVLSVVIPVGPMHGKLKAIQQTLFECQVLPIQLVVVCDDHQDGTKSELEKILNPYLGESVNLISGQFNGPGLARTAGLTLTSASWIAFWDADDYPNARASLSAIEETQDSLTQIICNQYAIYDAASMRKVYGSTVRKSESENLRAIGGQPGIWRFIFRKELISGMGFVDSRMGEDQEFLARVFAKNPLIQFTNHENYQYLVSRTGQLTGDNSNISQLIEIVPHLKAYYLTAPERYRECISLMLNQIILTMATRGDRKSKLSAVKHIAIHPTSFLKSFFTIIREKQLRNE